MTDKKRKPSKKKAVKKAYERTPVEQERLKELKVARTANPKPPRLKVGRKGEAVQIEFDHPDPGLGAIFFMDSIATRDEEFCNGLLHGLINASASGQEISQYLLNYQVSIVQGIKPRDQLETMLASQMAVTQVAIMAFAKRLSGVENIRQQDSAERAFNKLARTFTSQLEALSRYRTGGQQKVVVEHVTVNDGGQAIVGSVTPEGGGAQKK